MLNTRTDVDDTRYTVDHHWNPDHPAYDPDCYCGTPDGTAPGQRPRVPGDDIVPGPPPRRDPTRPSAKQAAYLGRLLDERKTVLAESIIARVLAILADLDSVDASELSELIDELKTVRPPKEIRRNRFPGPCVRCGQTVPAETGILDKAASGWIVLHEGSCPEPAPAPEPEPVAAEPVSARIPTGYYAVDDLRYYVDSPTRGKWAGWTFVKTGSDYNVQNRLGKINPSGQFVGSDRGRDVYEAIAADPAGAMAAYGQITGSCGACGRKLEDETSRALGIGPVCRTKGLFG